MDQMVIIACVPIAIGLLLVVFGIILANRYLGRHPNQVASTRASDGTGSEYTQPESRQSKRAKTIGATDASYPEPGRPAFQQSNTAQNAGAGNTSAPEPSFSATRKTYEKLDTDAHYAVPVPRPIDTGRRPSTASASRKHLMQLQDELQSQYYTLSKRIAAIDTDLGRTLDSLSRQVLEEQRDEYWNQREEIAAQMAWTEEQLDK